MEIRTLIHRIGILITIIIMTIPTIIKASPKSWVSVDGSKEGACYSLEIIESSNSVYRAKVKIHGLNQILTLKNDTAYHILLLEDEQESDLYGNPALPILLQQFYIPEGKDIEVSVQQEKWTSISMGLIYPVQKPISDSAEENDFIKNYQIYNSSNYIPQIVRSSDKMDYMGLQYINVSICPFMYYPVANKLSILSEFTLSIKFPSSKLNNNTNHISNIKPIQYDILSKSFANSNIIPFANKDVVSNTVNEYYDYLIIVGNIPGILECNAIKKFRTWKAFKGLKTYVVSTNTIGSSCESIKSFIQYEYQRLGGFLKYVLFVGDEDLIPVKLLPQYKLGDNDTTYSDSWYTCMGGDNDHQMDIPIGRFSTNDTLEIANIVNKTIKYEGCYYPYYDSDALLIAHCQYAPYAFQGCMEAIRNTTYNQSFSFDKLYGSTSEEGGDNATNTDIVNAINSKYNIVNYRGHGLPNSWCEWNYLWEWFLSPEINNIDEDVCSVFLSVACQNSNIKDSLTCIMEVFTRADHGAVAFLGATLDTERSNNNTFNKKLYKHLLDNSIVHIGQMIMESCKSITGYYHGQLNAYRYLLGGDPSLEIWTSSPAPFSDISFALTQNYINISSNSQNSFQVCIVAENGELLSINPTSNGTCSIPKFSDNRYIVLKKHNYIPYILHYNPNTDIFTHYNINTQIIQNQDFDYDAVYYNSPISIGYDVTENQTFGNVIVKSGHSLTLPMHSNVTIKNGFEVENGAEFEIK